MVTLERYPQQTDNIFRNIRYALDPALWAQQYMNLDPWQAAVMNDRSRRVHAVTSRQIGKSTVVSGKVWHQGWYGYESLILLIAPTLRQSIELIRKVKWFAHEAKTPRGSYKSSALSIEIYHTRSRIIALPGGNPANIRGFSGPQMVVIDEASFAKDELYRSIRPMLMTSDGQLIVISTPFVKQGFFWDIYNNTDEQNGEHWSKYEVPAWECPRVKSSFLDAERRAMGDWWFNSEYGCKFQDPINGLFTAEMITRASERPLMPLYDGTASPEDIINSRGHRPLYLEGI